MIIENGKYCVYCHTNKMNGKKYFGQTGLVPEKRWGKNGEKYKGSPYFYSAIQKYGWDGFYHDIIAGNLTLDEANNFEELMINKFHTQNPKFGYNIAYGGKNRTPTEDTRRKMVESHKGEKSYWARPVLCGGIRFGHIGACAEYYGIDRRVMNSYLTGRIRMPQKFIDLGLCYEDETQRDYCVQKGFARENNPRAKAVVCGGVEYKCVNDCADYYSINFHTMFNWLTGEKRMPQKFIDLGLQFIGENRVYSPQVGGKRPVICEGVKYDTIAECARHYGVKPLTMRGWLVESKKIPTKFANMGLAFINETKGDK